MPSFAFPSRPTHRATSSGSSSPSPFMKPKLLPLDPGSAVLEKQYLQSRSSSVLLLPIPFTNRAIPIPVPRALAGRLDSPIHLSTAGGGRARRGERGFKQRLRTVLIMAVAAVLATFVLLGFVKGFARRRHIEVHLPFQDPNTNILTQKEIRKMWEWEIEAGHYPSYRKVPDSVHLLPNIPNNGLPPIDSLSPIVRSRLSSNQVSNSPYPTNASAYPVLHNGPERAYFHVDVSPEHDVGALDRSGSVRYPPRPVPGSAIDMDVVMEHCDFSTGQYVRDCLEVLRTGAGLDAGNRVRRGSTESWKHLYTLPSATARSLESDLEKGVTIEPCDPDHPRLFHMFWAGPFTDKPYLALLSFLYTQNLYLHHAPGVPPPSNVCRPQFWVWINPGPAASIPNPSAVRDMYDSLAANPWSSPFLHERFADVIKFRMWNTTEQLDGVPELADHWRDHELFNSGGVKYGSPKGAKAKKEEEEAKRKEEEEAAAAAAAALSEEQAEDGGEDGAAAEKPSPTGKHDAEGDPLFNRVGSTSESGYDRLTVVLSDMARFLLCHRFGGTYLDADTLLLRDWEELWGWKGAFAYRWSRLEKYNTAVLRMHKKSALGSFLFRTALNNGLDFHPMTVSRYTKDANAEGLLLRLPDALFDPAWLNTEYYQRDRPPFPYFKEFKDLFQTPKSEAASPLAVGVEGFFKGAFSYHFHNYWWLPFDPYRNFPDLGPRFAAGERLARDALRAGDVNAKPANPGPKAPQTGADADDLARAFAAGEGVEEEEKADAEERDLSWATVLKRTFEAYVRGERPNMYGEFIEWGS